MSRVVPIWIGKTDDAAIPPRVRLRVFERTEGRCAKCTRDLIAGQWECDHVIPLILGGRHSEDNLQPLCTDPCHKGKSKLDAKLKATVARSHMRRAGIRKPSRFPGSRDSRWKKKIDGSVVLR